MSAEGPKTSAAADIARSSWLEVAACIEQRNQRLYEEIKHYPTPIAGCDQQFNYLLEQQARTVAELAQARQANELVAVHNEPLAVLASFLESSICIDDATKEQIRLRLAAAL